MVLIEDTAGSLKIIRLGAGRYLSISQGPRVPLSGLEVAPWGSEGGSLGISSTSSAFILFQFHIRFHQRRDPCSQGNRWIARATRWRAEGPRIELWFRSQVVQGRGLRVAPTLHTLICTYTHMYIHTCTHTHMYSHTYTHTALYYWNSLWVWEMKLSFLSSAFQILRNVCVCSCFSLTVPYWPSSKHEITWAPWVSIMAL